MEASDTHRAIEAVWKIERAKLVAGLSHITRDVGLAEELAQDALVSALERWPQSGVPERPGAWLMATAKNRAIDRLRRRKLGREKLEAVGYDMQLEQDFGTADPDEALDDSVGDELLSLVFVACHPVLSPDARVALTLRLLGGLSTEEIARAFLVPEATLAQRIVRAKKTLADANLPFEVPRGPELAQRLPSVLEVVYLIFNEGYSATSGEDWIRPALCEEALRLGRIIAELAPAEAEVHGLVALMEIQASRLRARTAPDGTPVLLLDQNRARWDRILIARGMAALARAARLEQPAGPYRLQAEIAACHARAGTAQATDWTRIAALYDLLAGVTPSPIVELNRAVAHGMAHGPATGLAMVDPLMREPALRGYHLLNSVRADLLARLGRHAEARDEFERAAGMTANLREQQFLKNRAAEAAAEA
ncbi:MAG: RNA polymerase sigma factor [Rhizobiaceae bacterium]